MQFKIFLPFLAICLMICFIPNNLDAQRIAKNRNGERIIIYPDGEWEKFDKKNSKHKAIEKKFRESIKKDGKITNEKEVLAKGGISESKGERIYREAKEQFLQAETDLKIAIENEEAARSERISLEEELTELEADPTVETSDLTDVEQKIKEAKSLESLTKKNRRVAKKHVKASRKALKKASPDDELLASKGGEQLKKKRRRSTKRTASEKSAEVVKDRSTLTEEAKGYAKYDMEKDVMFNPPKTKCGFLFDGVDEFLGKRRKDVNIGTFFNYTDENMRKYLGGKEYMICQGNFTQIEGGILLLNLYFSIATRDAERTFGGLNKGTPLTIKFIDDSKIKIVNTKEVKGQFDPLTERHNYVAQFIINSGQEKALKKGEIDKVRVVWGTGYEDYDVFDVDFFKDQLKCLRGK